MKAYYRHGPGRSGSIRYDMVNPRVVVTADLAVLTYNLRSTSSATRTARNAS